jgi:hypothetical protein
MAAERVFEQLIASTMGLHRLPERAAFGAWRWVGIRVST